MEDEQNQDHVTDLQPSIDPFHFPPSFLTYWQDRDYFSCCRKDRKDRKDCKDRKINAAELVELPRGSINFDGVVENDCDPAILKLRRGTNAMHVIAPLPLRFPLIRLILFAVGHALPIFNYFNNN